LQKTLQKAAGGAGKDLHLPVRSRFGKGRAAPLNVLLLPFQVFYRVYIKCYGMLPIKLVKEPHCKGLEAHLAADLCNIKVEYGRGEEI
jgi:hypothetical protein